MKNKPPSLHDQRLVASILTEFMFCSTMDEVWNIWKLNFEKFGLCSDPFTNCPCVSVDYAESCKEYDRQTMLERYGHCDGLD